jgi:hypothetical protein
MSNGRRRTMPGAAFGRSGGILGDGAGGKALRPSRGPRLRGGVMQGGSASGARASPARPARPVHLRLGARSSWPGQRRDGAIGGSVLGRRPRGATFRGSGTFSQRGSGPGKTHVPRFRRSKPGTLGSRGMQASFGGSGLGGSRHGSASGSSLNRRRGRAVFGRRTGRRWFGKRTGGFR